MVFCKTRYSCTERLDGKTALITGCNTGIGKETARDFYIRGARVIMACRNVDKANETTALLKTETAHLNNLGQFHIVELNLTSLKSVRQCATEVLETEEQLNLLVNNAGIAVCPFALTEDGFESQFGTNHVGHFLLTLLLLPKLIQSKPSRIVSLSSLGHIMASIDLDDLNFLKREYGPLKAYNQSKLAIILFSNELARRLKEHNIAEVNTYSLHPGVIDTEIQRNWDSYFGWLWRNIGKYFSQTPSQGTQTTIYCAVDQKCANQSGLYYSDCAVKTPSTKATDKEVAKKLWEISWKLTGLDVKYNPFVTSKTI